MTTYVYDGTLDGLFCVIFESFFRKAPPARIVRAPLAQDALFGPVVEVETDHGQAQRVERGLRRAAPAGTLDKLEHALLSDQPGVEMTIWRFASRLFDPPEEDDAGAWLGPMLEIDRLDRRLRAEVHRMHAFVRFEEQDDGLFVARIAPDFDVLPLVAPHFEARYPAQRWLLADVRRGYGLLHEVGGVLRRIEVLPDAADTPEEAAFQRLWRSYFEATTIAERRNLKLHLRHVPRRYWPYLTEKRAAA